MKRNSMMAGLMMLGLAAQAAQGKHIAKAVLKSSAGATVASLPSDPSGRVRFVNIPPGEYRLVLTNAEGRSVTVDDLDGRGLGEIIIEGRQTQGASFGEKSVGGALPGGAVASAAVASPRDVATGQATGRRQHKPYAFLVDWDGTMKGGFTSERAAQAEGEQLPENAGGRCAVKVLVEPQPGTIEVQSWSWSAKNKVGHVTLNR